MLTFHEFFQLRLPEGGNRKWFKNGEARAVGVIVFFEGSESLREDENRSH